MRRGSFNAVVVGASAGLLWLSAVVAHGETVFRDAFARAVGDVTHSAPLIDAQGSGWQTAPGGAALPVDARGHLFDNTTAADSACVQLVPIGPHGSMAITATMQLPAGFGNWVGMGFAATNEALTAAGGAAGPWLEVENPGNAIFYGGPGASNAKTIQNAFTNDGSPVTFVLTYDAFRSAATVASIRGGATNVILDAIPVATPSTARYAVFGFSSAPAVLTNRWIGPVAVDWIPRPPPLLALPVAPASIVTKFVNAPSGGDDTVEIQKALDYAATNGGPTEVRFGLGASYVISNASTVSMIPLTLSRASNTWINGNGAKILIKNPRIGFLHIQNCSNVIVQGLSVDYDPLPFTQGVVTRNFYTDPPQGSAPESAIEFRPDAGYPAPTNANYVDADAVASAERWGTIMNTNFPGRGADNRYTIYIYGDVGATTNAGVFKVHIPYPSQTGNILSNDYWCMVSRWNGSSVYSAGSCYQVTFLDLTNYTGAAANFEGQATPLINEINCHVEPGPAPNGATRPRIKSSNADGGYFGYTRIGPWVENCEFSGLSDDVANAYADPFVVTNKLDQPTNTFAVWNYNTDVEGGPPTAVASYYMQVGDQLDFFDARNGVIFDQATITAVNLPTVTVDHAVSGIVPGTYQTNTLIFNNSLNTSAVYLNNRFSNSRIHGIYCRANNMLIAHNWVSGMGESAISAFPALDLGSPNAFVPTNVLIMDNVLSDCSYTAESITNDIPYDGPTFALVELHQTRLNSDYVSNTFGISGIRILNNAFLDWRHAPLSLHNVTDFHVIGNYFGPPITSDGLVPLADDYIADLWSCDYANMLIAGNVNATGLRDDLTISEDFYYTTVAGAFEALASPSLSLNLDPAAATLSWSSIAPAFVLQQTSALGAPWVKSTYFPFLTGASNTVALPVGSASQFFRLIQR